MTFERFGRIAGMTACAFGILYILLYLLADYGVFAKIECIDRLAGP